jgi:hypothetical protein
MKPRNQAVLGLLQSLGTLSPLDAHRAFGISGGGLTKAISDLRNVHLFNIDTLYRKDPITHTRYPVYHYRGPVSPQNPHA